MRKTIIALVLIAIILPVLAFAAPTKSPLEINRNTLPAGPKSALSMIEIIGDWIFTVLLVLAVIFMLFAAYNYMGGSEEGVAKAHKMLLFTAVAVAVAMLAIGLVNAVQIFVTNPTY